ncbi:MAG TPA: hypothetical protein VFU71_14480 [Burkholderiaceae bacterium]|nr:hypothetical protein [Burkholderiaceae bacterium]
MKFVEPRRPNPFSNPLLRLALHSVASVLLLVALHAVLTVGFNAQFWLSVAALAGLELIWIYFALRR